MATDPCPIWQLALPYLPHMATGPRILAPFGNRPSHTCPIWQVTATKFLGPNVDGERDWAYAYKDEAAEELGLGEELMR